jgi:hypothetical protein
MRFLSGYRKDRKSPALKSKVQKSGIAFGIGKKECANAL